MEPPDRGTSFARVKASDSTRLAHSIAFATALGPARLKLSTIQGGLKAHTLHKLGLERNAPFI